MKKKNRTSLKWKLLRTVLLYWALPFLVLIAVIGIYMADSEENNQLEHESGYLSGTDEGDCCRFQEVQPMIRFCMTDTGITVRGRSVIRFSNEARNYLTLSMDIRKLFHCSAYAYRQKNRRQI